jgi:hypothetical protein
VNTPVRILLVLVASLTVPLLQDSIPDAAAISVGPLSVKPVKLKLGKQVFGTAGTTSAPKKVTLANKGTAPIALLDFSTQGDFAIDAATSTCGASLAPGTKCLLMVTFTPTALGDRVGQLTITHDAAGSPQTVALSGKGVPGQLTFIPSSLKFADHPVNESGRWAELVVHNPNPVPVPISGINLSGVDFSIAQRTCGTTLAGNADCTIALDFRPLAVGGRKGVLRIAALTKKSPKAVKVKGKGVALCNGVKAKVLIDPANCGGCGNVCPGICAGGQCQGASIACGITTPDTCLCGDDSFCTNVGTDVQNCGECGHVCFAGQTCQNGICEGCTSAGAPDQCGTLCTNFQTDPANCGGCGDACASGLCIGGQCLSCTVNAPHLCGDVCTNVVTDTANCGGCGNVCPSGEACVDGECAGIVCGSGTPQQCGGDRCTNLQTDPNNCSACGTVCGSESCVGGQCIACGGATPTQCGAACTDLTIDNVNCGACGNACPSGSTCSGGTCVRLSCAESSALQSALASELQTEDAAADPVLPRLIPCEGSSPDRCKGICTNLFTDPRNCGTCGTVCALGACFLGRCVDCKGDTPNICGHSCVDFFSDNKNCGGCESPCPAGEACLHGICQKGADCGGGVKTNINIDPDNCGSCGNKCTNAPCVRGKCRPLTCPSQVDVICNGVCTAVYKDPKNCGSCGHECFEGTCVTNFDFKGVCSTCSQENPDECNGSCTNFSSDRKNCGGCGIACTDFEECSINKCVACGLDPSRPTLCEGTCTNTNTDPGNCGTCNKLCGDDEYCFAGECTKCGANAPTRCGLTCTDTNADQNSCGACYHGCETGQKCVDGRCKGCVSNGAQLVLDRSVLEITDGDGGGMSMPETEALQAQQVCFGTCPPATPDACGPSTCVNLQTDPSNCGGCGNACASGTCDQGICALGNCGTFEATSWGGSVVESATDLCGGSASLSLDTSVANTFHMTPSATVPGGCDVSANLNLVQGGAICGVWGGLWSCGGIVDAGGTMSLGCNCNTAMGVGGSFSANTYSGGWSFSAGGDDANGDFVTDTGGGSFLLERQ